MSATRYRKLGSIISLISLIFNLLPLHALPAQAATIDLGEPAAQAHHRPRVLLESRTRPLSPAGLSAAAVLPAWFSPPAAAAFDTTQTAGLQLARPAALANLLDSSNTPKDPPLSAHDTLPTWFAPPQPKAKAQGRAVAVSPAEAQLSTVLPGWFKSEAAPASRTPRSGLDDSLAGQPAAILPGWFGSADTASELPANRASGPATVRGPPETRLLPGWFRAADSEPAVPDLAAAERPAEPLNWASLLGGSHLPLSDPPLRPLADCTPAADLDLQLFVPDPANVGNPQGDDYTINVTNPSTATTTTTGIVFEVTPSAGFFYAGNSAAGISTVDGPLSFSAPSTTTAGAQFDLTLSGNAAQTSLAPGETMIVSFRMLANSSAITGQPLNVALRSSSPSQQCALVSQNVPVAQGDVEISKLPANPTAARGETITWTITVSNVGDGPVYDAQLVDSPSTGLISISVSPDITPLFTLAPGEQRQYVVSATVEAPTDIFGNALDNSASVVWPETSAYASYVETETVTSTLNYNVAATCASASNLQMTLTPPPNSVNRGDVAGEIYTVTILNRSSSQSSTEVALLVDPNQGFYFKSGPGNAQIESSLDGIVSELAPYTDTTPGSAFSITIRGDVAEASLAPGEIMTFTFRLATNEDAKSGQLLKASLLSGNPNYQVCQSAQQNVATVRGNLVIIKDPAIQTAEVGQTVTWTVRLRNTGLGQIYGASFTDVIGSGYVNTSIPTSATTPVDIAPEQEVTYTVSAQINSCGNLTNSVTAQWSIGNADGTGTITNPVGDDVDILLQLDDPDIDIQMGTLPVITYCGALDAIIPITVTNNGGVGRNLRLENLSSGLSVSLDNAPDWIAVTNGYSYTPGILPANSSVTFTVRVTRAAVCAATAVDLSFRPRYQDACLLLQVVDTADSQSATLGNDAPTLNVTKAGDEVLAAGQEYTYTITVFGNNRENIGPGGIVVTDAIPSQLQVVALTSSNGTAITSGGNVIWTPDVTDTGTGAYNEVLHIRYRVPNNVDCGAGDSIINNVTAYAGSKCVQCGALQDSDSFESYIQDPLVGGFNSGSTTAAFDVCTLGAATSITSVVNASSGITWSGAIFHSDLGQGDFAGNSALRLVPGSVRVEINGLDRTGSVTVTEGVTLSIEFDNVGVYSSSAQITVTYDLTANSSVLGPGEYSRREFVFSSFTYGGLSGSGCGSGATAYAGTFLTVNRGSLLLSVSPSAIETCRVNTVTLQVTNQNAGYIANNLVVTLTVDSADIVTPSAATYGGDFAGNPPSSVISSVVGSVRVITFIFPSGFSLNSAGTINLPLYRPCNEQEPLVAGLSYQDQCDVSYGDSGQGGQSTLQSDVTLFVTPNAYQVPDREAQYQFYVSNNGDASAVNLVVTSSLPTGYLYDSFTASGNSQLSVPQLNAISVMTAAVAGRTLITFNIPSLPVGGRVNFFVDVLADQCTDPAVLFIALPESCNQVGGQCGDRQDAQVLFTKGSPSLLSSNDQEANLKLCGTGPVNLEIKNTSAKASLYDFVITEILTNVSILTGSAVVTVTDGLGNPLTGTTSGQLLAGLPFTPSKSISTAGGDFRQALLWSLTNTAYISGTPQYDVLAKRRASEIIQISFLVESGCQGLNALVSSEGRAEDICGTELSFQEDSIALIVDKPEVVVRKTGKLVTDTTFSDKVYANVGDQVVWQLTVENVGGEAANTFNVRDILPPNFEVITSTGTSPTPTQVISSGGVTSELWWSYLSQPLDVGDVRQFYITGTFLGSTCASTQTNQVEVNFGCSPSDTNCLSAPVADAATLDTQPDLSFSAVADLRVCDGVITVTIDNDGPPAFDVTITDVLPSGYQWDGGSVFSSATPSQFGAVNSTTLEWRWSGTNTLPTGQSTLSFRVVNDKSSGLCNAPVTVDNVVLAEYDNSCSTLANDVQTDTLAIQSPELVVAKLPNQTNANVGDQIVWTLFITNSGSIPATDIRITDTVGSGFNTVSAGPGSGGDRVNTPVTSSVGSQTVITWTPGVTIAAGSTWQANVTATVLAAGVQTNSVSIEGFCLQGCRYGAEVDTAYVTLFAEFTKQPDVQTGTIGSLAVFTFSASLQDASALYQAMNITDTLPAGLGYLDSRLSYTYNSGVNLISNTPTLTSYDTDKQTTAIIWQLGNLTGPVTFEGVITTVVQDIASNRDETRRTNTIDVTYSDDGQDYAFNDAAAVDIYEPVLHLGKRYRTAGGCAARLLEDNFNSNSAASWITDSVGGSWQVVDGIYQYSGGGGNRRTVLSDSANSSLTDYSFSALLRSTDGNGHMGLLFRLQDLTNTYRLRWGGPNVAAPKGGNLDQRGLQLERVFGGFVFPLASDINVRYNPGTWHHVEIRAVGDLLAVYIDGALALTTTDANYASGGVGLYANDNDLAYFDDVLVTRLDGSGCFAGAGDTVTYTLTISNQRRWPAYDLVVSDTLPSGLELATYTLSTNDPTAPSFTAEPTVGAGGVITWGIDHLTPTMPFTALDHTFINLSVVLTVSPDITANIALANQAALAYDNWQTDTNPIAGVSRSYSGGSHATAIRTVANSGLSKTVSFDPPPTATLGTLVTYTLFVPARPISAALYSVAITDQLDAPLFYIESITTTGGLTATSGFSRATGLITATFAKIPAYSQALVTVTTRISYQFTSPLTYPVDTDVITNSAVMIHETADALTRSNTVSTTVGEPDVTVSKAAASSTGSLSDLDGQALVTYTIRLTNGGSSPAYSVHLSDSIPAGISVTQLLPGSYASTSGPVVGAGVVTWTFDVISNVAPANVVTVSYTAVLSQAPAGARLTNTVDIRYSSLTETIPGVKPYTATAGAVVSSSRISTAKLVEPASGPTNTLRLGDVVTYTVLVTIPAATVIYWPQIVDTLPPGFRYVPATPDISVTSINILGGQLMGSVVTGTVGSGVTQREVLTWQLLSAANTSQTETGVISSVFAVQITGQTPGGSETPLRSDQPNAISRVNNETVSWNITDTGSFSSALALTESSAVTSVVGQPELSILKQSDPAQGSFVGAGQTITYSLRLTNSGHSPAYDIVISDVLPGYLSYVTSSITSTSPATIAFTAEPALDSSGLITWQVTRLDGSDPAAANTPRVATLTVVASVSNAITANLRFTNTAAIPYYDSMPDDAHGPLDPPQRVYSDGSSSVWHQTPDGGLGKLRVAVDPPQTVTLGSVITYRLTVPASPITAVLYNLLVTDTIDSRLVVEGIISSATSVSSVLTNVNGLSNNIALQISEIPATEQVFITVTTRLSHETPSALADANRGDIISNSGYLTHASSSAITQSNTVTVEVGEPLVTVTKQAVSSIGSNERLTGDTILTYTIFITNLGNSPAYSIVLSDIIPTGLDIITMSQTYPNSGPDTNPLTWTLDSLSNVAPNNGALVTYTARVSGALSNVVLQNTAEVFYHSLTDTISGVRPYTGTASQVVTATTAPPELLKTTDPLTLEIGDTLTYTLLFTVPAAVIGMGGSSYLRDTLPEGMRYISGSATLDASQGGVVTSGQSSGISGTQQVLTWTFGTPITSPPGSPVVVTVTFRAQAVGVRIDDGSPVWPNPLAIYNAPNRVELIQRGVFISDSVVTNTVIQPDLTLAKTSSPASGTFVDAGQTITYSLTVTNSGRAAAYDLVITDVLPAGLNYQTTISNPAGAVITSQVVGQQLTYTVSTLAAGPASTLVLTVVAQVDGGITANLRLTNTATISTYDSQPGPGPQQGLTPTQRTYPGNSASVMHLTGWAGLSKSVTPATVTLGSVVTYTIIVPTPPITATVYNVTVTDRLANALDLQQVTASGAPGSVISAGNAFTVTYSSIVSTTQRVITVTAILSAQLGAVDGNVITNQARLTHASGVTTSNQTAITVTEPGPVITKAVTISADPQAAGYTITVVNTGTSTLYDAAIIDRLPAGISVTNISGGGQFVAAGRLISWTIASLAPNASTVLTYSAQLTEPLYAASLFTNTAYLTGTSLAKDVAGVRTYTDTDPNIFLWPLGRIGNYVWLDVDYSGRQDVGAQQPISNVLVDLYDSSSGRFITSTRTSVNGFYTFTNLPLGVTYTVQLSSLNFTSGQPLNGLQATRYRLSGSSAAVDSDAALTATFNGAGYAVTTTVLAASSVSTEDLTLDFGFVPQMSLGNRVWEDANHNGQLDAGEPGLSGVVVELYRDSNGDGQITPGLDQRLSSATTLAGGYYTFTNLLPSRYLTEQYAVVLTGTNFGSSGVLSSYVNTRNPISASKNSGDDNLHHGFQSGTLGAGGLIASTVFSLTVGQEPDGGNANFTLDFGLLRFDYGDLPDGYATLAASSGARHIISPTNNPTLGALVDAERDGQPSTGADGDNSNDLDDEDGVQWSPLVPGRSSRFTVTALLTGAYLHGWVDWNGDGDFGDANEQIVTAQTLTQPVTLLTVAVPTTGLTLTGPIYMRFRYSTSSTLAASGDAPDGEVEDYRTTLTAYDFGDLPDSTYPTGLANNGPRHVISAGVYLGQRVDVEGDGQGTNRQASGDDAAVSAQVGAGPGNDEDGVAFLDPIMPNSSARLQVTASITGYLSAWFDFNGDGQLDGLADQFSVTQIDGTPVVSSPVNLRLSPGLHTLVISTPNVTISSSLFSRFRFTTQDGGATAPTGLAADGEVEDYVLMSLGDLVWLDSNNNGQLDGGEQGIPTVTLRLFRSGQNPLADTPLATTTTGADGRYLFTGLTPGGYFVHIPPSDFAVDAPLAGLLSSVGAGDPDADQNEDQDENGLDSSTPILDGIRTGVITLALGAEPITDTPGGSGGDANANLTLDLGFYAGPVPGLSKAVSFSPPATATLGTTVTYVITVPGSAVARDLVDVQVSDRLDGSLQPLTATTQGGLTPTVTLNGQDVTVSFGQIDQGAQAIITITAIISDLRGALASDVITNAASLTYTGAAAITTSNVVSTTVGEPNLTVTKVAQSNGNLNALDGSNILTYTLRLENRGSSPAYSVHVTDTVPAGISVTAVLPGSYLATSGPVVGQDALTWSIASLSNAAPNNVITLTYTARLTAGVAAGDHLTNSVQVRSTSLTETVPGVRPYLTNTSATVRAADRISAAKYVAPASSTASPLRIGDLLTYTVVMSIPAGLVIYWPQLVDTLPGGLRYVPGSLAVTPAPAISGGTLSGSVVTGTSSVGVDQREVITWNLTPLTNSNALATEVVTSVFLVQLTGETPGGSPVMPGQGLVYPRQNQVIVYWNTSDSGSFDPASALSQTSVVTSFAGQPRLTLAKTASPASGAQVGAGDVISYQLAISNSGYAPAYDIVLTDTLPAGLDYQTTLSNPAGSVITAQVSGQAITYTIDQLAAGPTSSLVLTVVAQVNNLVAANSRLTNTATISTYDSMPDDEHGPLTPTQRTYRGNQASAFHLTGGPALGKAVSPATITLGSVVTYSLTVPETPISAALYSLTITDRLSAALDLRQVNAGSGSLSRSGNAFTVTYGLIPAGEQRHITITAILSDGLGAVAGNVISNTASLTYSGATILQRSNTVSTTVVEPDVTVSKSAQSSSGSLADLDGRTVLTYVIRVENQGSGPAYSVRVSDTVPAGISVTQLLDSYPHSGPAAGQAVMTWTLPALAPAAAVNLTYTARLSGANAGTALTNQVVVGSSSLTETIPGTRAYVTSTTETVTVTGGINTGKFVMPASSASSPLRIGDLITYTVVMSISPAVAVYWPQLVDTLPVGVRYLPGSLQVTTSPGVQGGALSQGPQLGTSGSGLLQQEVMTWYLSPLTNTDLQAAGVISGRFVAQVTGETPGGTTVIVNPQALYDRPNRATVAWNVTDSGSFNPSGALSQSSVVSSVVGQPWLLLAKAASPAAGTIVDAGQVISYRLTISNSGPVTAYDIVLSDTLPPGVEYQTTIAGPISGSLSTQAAGSQLTYSISELAAGGRLVLTVVTRITDTIGAAVYLTNTAALTRYDSQPGSGPQRGVTPTERVYADGSASVVHQTAGPDLVLRKTAEPAEVVAGRQLTYTLTVSNVGRVAATGVVLVDSLPAGVSLVGASGSYSGPVNGVITWPVGLLLPDAQYSATVLVRVDNNVVSGTSLVNVGRVSSSESVSDTDLVTTPVVALSDVALIKQVTPTVVVAGEVLTYTLVFSNNGPSAASGVLISDTLPSSVTFGGVVRVDAPFVTVQNGGAPDWSANVLAAGTAGVIIYTATVASAVRNGAVLTNQAAITSSSPDSNPDNNSVQQPVQAINTDLAIAKQASPVDLVAGLPVTYTLWYTNYGPADAVEVVISDTLPIQVAYLGMVGAQPSVNGPNQVGQRFAWTLPALAAGASGQFSFTVQTLASYSGIITNDARIGSDTPDRDPGNNQAESPVQLRVPAIQVDKSVSESSAVKSAVITYTINITNSGEVTFTSLRITDTLPAGLNFHQPVAPTQPPAATGNQLVWLLPGTLRPGEQLSLIFQAQVVTGTTGDYLNLVEARGVFSEGSVTDDDQAYLTIADPSAALSKNIEPPGVQNGVITFTIAVSNTGPSVLDVIKLIDSFDGPIIFQSSTPQVSSSSGSNVLVWDDLTAPPPYGFGRNLAPGRTFVVTTTFALSTKATDFSLTNTAVVTEMRDVYDNPAEEATDDNQFENIPTVIDLRYFVGEVVSSGVRLRWATAVEIDNFGFRLLRSESGQLADAAEIAFVPASGRNTGDTYRMVDIAVTVGTTYTYWLVDVDTFGRETIHGPVVVTMRDTLDETPGDTIYLPLILRSGNTTDTVEAANRPQILYLPTIFRD